MPSVIEGLVTDQNILSNERVVDMSEIIGDLDPDETQFWTALEKIGTKPAYSSLVEWLEDEYYPRVVSISGSISAAATTACLRVASGSWVKVNDIGRVANSGEAIHFTAVTGSSVWTIVRSIGTVAGITAPDGTEIVLIGNAAAQGATLGDREVVLRTRAYNYTQIFRHAYGFTETLAASKLYTGGEPARERRKKAVEHKRDIEQAFFNGPREFNTTDIRGFMGGLREYISTNITTGTNLTETSFDDFLRTALHRGSKNKVSFCAPRVAGVLSGMLRDGWVRAQPSQKAFGAKVDSWVSGVYGWDIPIMVKRDWNEFAAVSQSIGGVNALGSELFVVDMDAVRMRPLRTTRLLVNRQAPSADETTEEYLTEISMEVSHERKHALLQGVT